MFYLFREETSNIRRSASQSSIIVFSFTFPSRPSRPSSSRCSSHFLATRSRSVRVAERRDGFKVRAKLLSRSNREIIQLVTLIRRKKKKKKKEANSLLVELSRGDFRMGKLRGIDRALPTCPSRPSRPLFFPLYLCRNFPRDTDTVIKRSSFEIQKRANSRPCKASK